MKRCIDPSLTYFNKCTFLLKDWFLILGNHCSRRSTLILAFITRQTIKKKLIFRLVVRVLKKLISVVCPASVAITMSNFINNPAASESDEDDSSIFVDSHPGSTSESVPLLKANDPPSRVKHPTNKSSRTLEKSHDIKFPHEYKEGQFLQIALLMVGCALLCIVCIHIYESLTGHKSIVPAIVSSCVELLLLLWTVYFLFCLGKREKGEELPYYFYILPVFLAVVTHFILVQAPLLFGPSSTTFMKNQAPVFTHVTISLMTIAAAYALLRDIENYRVTGMGLLKPKPQFNHSENKFTYALGILAALLVVGMLLCWIRPFFSEDGERAILRYITTCLDIILVIFGLMQLFGSPHWKIVSGLIVLTALLDLLVVQIPSFVGPQNIWTDAYGGVNTLLFTLSAFMIVFILYGYIIVQSPLKSIAKESSIRAY